MALSWIPAMTGSRNPSITIASVEWLRSHGGNPIVTQIENWYYTLNEPEKGGPALTSLPQVGDGAAGSGEEEGGGGGRGKPAYYEPANVNPLIHPALHGEGIWQKAGGEVGSRPPVLLTTFRSDPEYPQFVAGVAWIDKKRAELAYVPGLAEPLEPIEDRGSGEVPPNVAVTARDAEDGPPGLGPQDQGEEVGADRTDQDHRGHRDQSRQQLVPAGQEQVGDQCQGARRHQGRHQLGDRRRHPFEMSKRARR
ncbi:MAG TPA: hypothetical protein VGI17_14975 [Solirubrobacterales bacterium]